MTQAIDFRFEILFLAWVLISILGIVAAVGLRLDGRRPAANRVLAFLGAGWVGYIAIVFLVAAGTRQQSIPMGDDLCFDEMCFAVANVQTAQRLGTVRSQGVFYVVTLRISSRARGRAEAELGLGAQLWSPGHRHAISGAGQKAWQAIHPASLPLTSRLLPGQSILSELVFDISERESPRGLALTHGWTPGYLIIGECPLFHPPTILRLTQGE